MKYTFFYTLFLLTIGFSAFGQSDIGLIAHYTFDDCTATDSSPDLIGGNGTVIGNPVCDCGVSGDAMVFDGIDDNVTFSGNVNAVFERNNFTISFYFKPFDGVTSQNILSKRVDCTGAGSFLNIEYLLSLNFINVEMQETPTKKIAISSNLDLTCWHHFALVREAKRVKMYLNGNLIDEKVTSTVLDLTNSALFSIANSPCIGSSTDRFRGKLDDLRVYNRALLIDEVQDLYFRPDLIKNNDEIIYLGQTIDAEIPVTCADNFSWTPTTNVSDASSPNPILSPTETTTYQVSILDNSGCTTTDSIRVTVIDPADLDCSGIFLPKGFTPNDDGLNDVFGISNPLAIQQLVAFEIYDRIGTRVFTTTNGEDTWDGTYRGTFLNGGVFVYKVTYICEGNQTTLTGAVTMIR